MKLKNRKLTVAQATCHYAVRQWADKGTELPSSFSPDAGDKVAIVAEISRRIAGGDVWNHVATKFGRKLEKLQSKS